MFLYEAAETNLSLTDLPQCGI